MNFVDINIESTGAIFEANGLMQLNSVMNGLLIAIKRNKLSDYLIKILGHLGYLFQVTTLTFEKNNDLLDGQVTDCILFVFVCFWKR